MAIDLNFLEMEWQNGFEATLDARVVLTDEYIPMTPVPEGDFGRLVLEDTSKENFEIIRYNRKDATGVFVEVADGGLRNEDGSSSGIHPRGARIRGNITAQDIRELRAAAKAAVDEFTAFVATLPDWRPIVQVPTVISSAGQKEHVIRYSGVDLTNSFGEGAKLRIPRTGTTPTTSFQTLAASNQYASKASPAGLSFVDDFSFEGWVSPLTHTATNVGLISRRQADTSGFSFGLSQTGQIEVVSLNGGAYRIWNSYQSVPLYKWTHIAATVDISASTYLVYIDGVLVPGYMSATNGSMTAIAQANVDLRVGARKSTDILELFNGQFANIRIWSTIRTAQQIRDNMNQETPASTTGLVAHYKGNGSWNDSSANANHLTASGSAINNFASHPYSAVEFAFVTAKPVYSGGNTDVTIFTGSGALPTETLGATSYSTAKSPYGFPTQPTKWRVQSILKSQFSGGVVNTNNFVNVVGYRLYAPRGEWKLGYEVYSIWANGANVTYTNTAVGLSTSASNYVFELLDTKTLTTVVASAQVQVNSFVQRSQNYSVAAGLAIYLVQQAITNNQTIYVDGSSAPCIIYADCAYL